MKAAIVSMLDELGRIDPSSSTHALASSLARWQARPSCQGWHRIDPNQHTPYFGSHCAQASLSACGKGLSSNCRLDRSVAAGHPQPATPYLAGTTVHICMAF